MLYRRGNVYWLKFRHKGVRYQLSTGETNRRKAEAKARAIRVEIERTAGRPGKLRGIPLCRIASLDMARVVSENLGARRSRTVEGLWFPLLRELGEDMDVCGLTIGRVLEYVGTRRKTVRGQTIRREVQALVRGLKIAKRDRIISDLPFDPEEIPTIRSDPAKPEQRGKLWRLEEIEAVLNNLSAKAITAGHRDRCRLILLTGLRLEELHKLQPSWVGRALTGEPVLDIPQEAAKWGKARTVPLCQEALEIVERCAPFKRKKPNKSLALASSKAGIRGVVTPRDLRTFFLTHAARIGDPVAAQRLGGHTNIATTGLYLQSDTERTIAVGLETSAWISQKWLQQGGYSGPLKVVKGGKG